MAAIMPSENEVSAKLKRSFKEVKTKPKRNFQKLKTSTAVSAERGFHTPKQSSRKPKPAQRPAASETQISDGLPPDSQQVFSRQAARPVIMLPFCQAEKDDAETDRFPSARLRVQPPFPLCRQPPV